LFGSFLPRLLTSTALHLFSPYASLLRGHGSLVLDQDRGRNERDDDSVEMVLYPTAWTVITLIGTEFSIIITPID